MLGNLVNAHDVRKLAEKVHERSWGKIRQRLTPGRRRKVEAAWSHVESVPAQWWNVPGIQERWNKMVSGDPAIDHRRWLTETFLGGRTGLKGLSLGCGTGAREQAWARLGIFEKLEGIDLSKARIEHAREQARLEGLDGCLGFRVADVNALQDECGTYDVVIAEQSLHHFAPMGQVLARIEELLDSDGWFFIDEYVGPTRFQWTTAQLAAVDELLQTVPDPYRTQWHDGRVRARTVRPSRLSMILRDPSEAVDSAMIVPAMEETFDIQAVRGYGGTLLHPLFQDIAQNYAGEDEETLVLVARLFAAEDELMQARDLPHDFIVAASRKRAIAPAVERSR